MVVREVMAKFVDPSNGFTWRFWLDKSKLPERGRGRIVAVETVEEFTRLTVEQTLDAMAAEGAPISPAINAVEVLNAAGDGELLYPDWP